jgi:hypothetical protein
MLIFFNQLPMDDAPQPTLSRLSFLAGFGFGAFIGGALALLAVFLVREGEPEPQVVVAPTAVVSATPSSPFTTVTPELETLPRTIAPLDVRIGPGEGFAIIGQLGRDEPVQPVGRNSDRDWVAVRFPPGSSAIGWLPVEGIDDTLSVSGLAVVLPTPLSRSIPDFPGGAGGAGDDGDDDDGTPLPGETVTPVPSGRPDLIVNTIVLLADNRIAAVITNRGPGAVVNNAIFVTFRNLGTRTEQVRTPVSRLNPGESITVASSAFTLVVAEEIQVIADPTDSLPEANEGNNLRQVFLEFPPTPTPTPTATPRALIG